MKVLSHNFLTVKINDIERNLYYIPDDIVLIYQMIGTEKLG